VPVNGAVVDGVQREDDLAARGFDALPDGFFLGGVARQPRLVGEDDADVPSALDAADGFQEGGALGERQSAADVVFGGQQVERVAGRDRAANGAFLVAVAVEAVGADFASSEAADADDARPGGHGGSLRGYEKPCHYEAAVARGPKEAA
jgi:hypothetical protein